jgi:hypothetical protein
LGCLAAWVAALTPTLVFVFVLNALISLPSA